MAKVKYYAKENSSIGTHSFYAVPIPNGTLTFDELLDEAMDGYMVRDDDDFSATDWAEEFRGQYKTPMQLIEILQDTAKLLKEGIVPNKSKSYWQDVLEQCKGWEADTDNEYAEEAR